MFGKYTRGPFADPSHRKFNKRFEELPSTTDIVKQPWLSNDAYASLPNPANDFDRARDPYIAKQLDDRGTTEAERREEALGRHSKMVAKDRPEHKLRPPPEISQTSDRRAFACAWLQEQRDAAMEQARMFEKAERELRQNDYSPQSRKEPGFDR